MADDGHGRAFAAGAGGGGHGDERHLLATGQVFAAHQGQNVVGTLTDEQLHALGGVQHRAAAQRHDAMATMVAVELCDVVDSVDAGVGGYAVEQQAVAQAGDGAEAVGQPQFHQRFVGQQQRMLHAQVFRFV